ncbi:hypothetical protein GCM10022215_36930 [Nocardioides fonticola]|uniref:Uncharacterized protein n=1 Tax=Nocardioides fonticola TaxID=450363 RepID=A0ABP7XVV1_9ACTN
MGMTSRSDIPDRAAIAAWVEASCRAQGVEVRIGDRRVVAQVAVLLGNGVGDPNGKRSADGAPTPDRGEVRHAS